MPIYTVDLQRATNFSKMPGFHKEINEAKEIWQNEFGTGGIGGSTPRADGPFQQDQSPTSPFIIL